jgi:FkbM family methyltransferase
LSYKKVLIRLLDRPGGRSLLGKIATRVVAQDAGHDIEIAYINGLWTRRVGPDFFPDSVRFEYTYAHFDGWKYQMERYAADTREYWLRHYQPKEGDVIVDVGAGRGEDTVTFSRAVGKTGRVIAIEAHPLSFAMLENFCRLNGLTNVTAYQLAVVEKSCSVRIGESGWWQENAIVGDEDSSGILVQADTLDELWKREKMGEIAFLKMNIEGSEREALLGMRSVMPHIRQICVACHDFRANLGHGERFRTRALVMEFLRDYGFTLVSRADDPHEAIRDHIFGFAAAGSPRRTD